MCACACGTGVSSHIFCYTLLVLVHMVLSTSEMQSIAVVYGICICFKIFHYLYSLYSCLVCHLSSPLSAFLITGILICDVVFWCICFKSWIQSMSAYGTVTSMCCKLSDVHNPWCRNISRFVTFIILELNIWGSRSMLVHPPWVS